MVFMLFLKGLPHPARGLQRPRLELVEKQVLEDFVRLYERLDQDRTLVPRNHFHEVRCEEQVVNPIGEIESSYEAL